jgi:hypothetical protein
MGLAVVEQLCGLRPRARPAPAPHRLLAGTSVECALIQHQIVAANSVVDRRSRRERSGSEEPDIQLGPTWARTRSPPPPSVGPSARQALNSLNRSMGDLWVIWNDFHGLKSRLNPNRVI